MVLLGLVVYQSQVLTYLLHYVNKGRALQSHVVSEVLGISFLQSITQRLQFPFQIYHSFHLTDSILQIRKHSVCFL